MQSLVSECLPHCVGIYDILILGASLEWVRCAVENDLSVFATDINYQKAYHSCCGETKEYARPLAEMASPRVVATVFLGTLLDRQDFGAVRKNINYTDTPVADGTPNLRQP